MTNLEIKNHLINAGIKNMNEFGYPYVTIENILIDEAYSIFFKKMLIENLGNGKEIDIAINELLDEIKK